MLATDRQTNKQRDTSLSVKTQTPLHGFVADLLYSLLYNKSATNPSSEFGFKAS